MRKVKLKQLIDFLKEENIDFELYLNDFKSDNELAFASVKNCIKNGIFYLENSEALSKFEIEASVVISNKNTETKNCLIVVSNPQLVHYKLCNIVKEQVVYDIANSSKIHKNAQLAKNISIGENCVIGECSIEEGVVIKHNVVIENNVTIKKNTFIDSNSVIGAGGLAWIWDEKGNRIIQPQLGGVMIEENCVLATDVTIVRGSLSENTTIENCFQYLGNSNISDSPTQFDEFSNDKIPNNDNFDKSAFPDLFEYVQEKEVFQHENQTNI